MGRKPRKEGFVYTCGWFTVQQKLTQQCKVTNYSPIKNVKKSNETVTFLFEGIKMSTTQLEIHESSKALWSTQSIIHEIRKWWMRRWILAEPIVAIISQYISVKTVMLYPLNLYSQSVSSVTQSCPTLRPHESQHARPPCPSPPPGVCSNACPSSWWCHPAIWHTPLIQ